MSLANSNNSSSTIADAVKIPSNDSNPSDTLIFPLVVQIIGVVVFFLLKRFRLQLPYAACIFVIGTIMGLGSEVSDQDDVLTISIQQWTRIDVNVLLLVFLPGLIFRDAIDVNINLFQLSLPQLLLLAFPLVLVGTGMIAAVCVYVLPYRWSWSLGATLGAILSSTDPVAVAAVLNDAGAPPRLKMHISGESLINDGSAIVFYTIFQQIYLSDLTGEEPIGWASGIKLFFQMSLGGLATGIAFALCLVLILYELDRRLDPEYDVLQVMSAMAMAYISFYVADQVFNVSGVIATVTCGIGSAWLGKGLINDAKLMSSYLSLMEQFLNTQLFALGGAMWGAVIFGELGWARIWAIDWGYLVAFFFLVILIRFVQVILFYPLLSRMGLESNIRESTFLAFAGIRGSVGIALADNLFRTVTRLEAQRQQVSDFTTDATLLVFLSGGISLGTLALNGTAASTVLRWLGLNLPEAPRKRTLGLYESTMETFVTKEYKNLLGDVRFTDINNEIIQAHVPFLKSCPTRDPPQLTREVSSFSQRSFTGESSIHALSVGREPEDIVPEMRLMFLEMLQEAYRKMLACGELNNKEDEALNVDVFVQSVDFAMSYHREQPINDWELLQIFENVHEDAKTMLRQRLGNRSFWKREHKARSSPNDEQQRYRKRRTKVLRAICFISAHQRAIRHLEAYSKFAEEHSSVRISFDSLESALETVREESRGQVMQAKAVLEACPEKLSNFIISHYAATIILNRLAKHVEKGLEEGALLADEARSFLDLIEKNAPNHHVIGRFCDCLENTRHAGLDVVLGQGSDPRPEDEKLEEGDALASTSTIPETSNPEADGNH